MHEVEQWLGYDAEEDGGARREYRDEGDLGLGARRRWDLSGRVELGGAARQHGQSTGCSRGGAAHPHRRDHRQVVAE